MILELLVVETGKYRIQYRYAVHTDAASLLVTQFLSWKIQRIIINVSDVLDFTVKAANFQSINPGVLITVKFEAQQNKQMGK